MASLSDIQRAWLLKMLGLSSSSLSSSDLELKLKSGSYTAGYTPAPPVAEYFHPMGGQQNSAISTWADQSMYLSPIIIPTQMTLDRIGTEIATAGNAGALVRLGIYSNNGTKPGSLLLDAGTIDAATTGVKEITINLALAPDFYWIAMAWQSSATTRPGIRITDFFEPVLPISSTVQPAANSKWGSYTVTSGISGALPANPPAYVPGVYIPKVFLRRSA